MIFEPAILCFANKKPESQWFSNQIVKLIILNCEATSRKIKVTFNKVFYLSLKI